MRMNDAGTPAFVSAPRIVSPSTIGNDRVGVAVHDERGATEDG
jgi:hypothetical protein